MIYEVFGLPRSGKTTFLTAIAQKALKAERCFLSGKKYDKVFTNFYCKGAYQIDFSALPYFDFSDCLIIIDEISLYADNRDYKKFSSEMLEFFKLHGHQKLDLVWSSQACSDADKKIRDVTDTIYYLSPSAIPHFSTVRKIYHNVDFNNRQVTDCYDLSKGFRLFYRKKWYKYFDSYSKDDKPFPQLVRW